MKSANRGEVWRVPLDPIKGREQSGFRYVCIVSPDSMNHALDIVHVVPLTTNLKSWPTRVNTQFLDTPGQAQCEQIRAISKQRLKENKGTLAFTELAVILQTLRQVYTD